MTEAIQDVPIGPSSAGEALASAGTDLAGDFGALRLKDSCSLRLRASATLGQPLGCLKIAPGPGLSKMQEHHAQYVYFFAMAALLGAVTFLSMTLLPGFGRNEFKILLARTIAAVAIICLIIVRLRLKDARTVVVYERGVRFTDRRDAVGAHEQFAWDQVDPCGSRATVQHAVGLDTIRLTCTFRLKDFSVAAKSHELSLIVTPKERKVAGYLVNCLRCNVHA